MIINIHSKGLDLSTAVQTQIEHCFEFLQRCNEPFSQPAIYIDTNQAHHDIRASITLPGTAFDAFAQHKDLNQALLEIRSQMVRQLSRYHLLQQTQEKSV